jgi:molecular chaperone DnaK
LTGKEPSKNLNPDECVAIGAAVQGGKLGGTLLAGSSAAEIVLMDVTPLSLSIETVGGVSTRLISRNTTIPTRYSQVFSTAANFQTTVDIKVLQGERQFAKDNKLIGRFQLRGIKPAAAGVPQIEVTFDIDANGIVQVSAKDLGTGKHQEITITASSNLSDAEIERAIREAQEYEASDGQRKAYLDARSEADTLAQQVEYAMKEQKKTMDKSVKKQIKPALSYVKKLVSVTQPGNVSQEQALEIQKATRELRNAASSILS